LAQVTCQICKLKEDKILMYQEKNKKYYHIELCHGLYIKENERKKEENRKWSDLYEYLKVLHNVPDVPPRNIMRLKKELYETKGYYLMLINYAKIK
jgi:aminoglycoside phosphotransferase